MKTMQSILKEEIKQLESIIVKAEKRLEHAPQGNLRITKKRKGVEYFYKNNEEQEEGDGIRSGRKEKYIKKQERDLANAIAQRDYDMRVVKVAKERIRVIKRFLGKYEKTRMEAIYEKTNIYRRELIKEAEVVSDSEYILQWLAAEYEGKDFSDYETEIVTERGERVRSKSEKIIADKLYALGIPYRYEYPLTLEGKVIIYPDFTILRMPMREEVYLEHFGKMDDGEYVEKTIYKLRSYEKNGIHPGVNLFFTYETGKMPLNTRNLDQMMKKLFCAE